MNFLLAPYTNAVSEGFNGLQQHIDDDVENNFINQLTEEPTTLQGYKDQNSSQQAEIKRLNEQIAQINGKKIKSNEKTLLGSEIEQLQKLNNQCVIVKVYLSSKIILFQQMCLVQVGSSHHPLAVNDSNSC